MVVALQNAITTNRSTAFSKTEEQTALNSLADSRSIYRLDRNSSRSSIRSSWAALRLSLARTDRAVMSGATTLVTTPPAKLPHQKDDSVRKSDTRLTSSILPGNHRHRTHVSAACPLRESTLTRRCDAGAGAVI